MQKFFYVVFSLLIGLSLCTCDPAQKSQGVGESENQRVNESDRQTVSSTTRTKRNLNAGWTYYETIATTPAAAMETAGTPTTLPHTWNQWDAVDMLPGYRRSAGWYVRDLSTTAASGERKILYFEGANTKAEVFLNGKKVGGHIGGYVGFDVDITDNLTSGNNQLAVRVTNEYDRDLIPSQKSDFFIYGGLTRDVWLKTVPATYLTDLRISTPEVSAASATTKLEISLTGFDQFTGSAGLEAEIQSPSGEFVSQATIQVTSGGTTTLEFPAITNPQLWSPDAPNRYKLHLRLMSDNIVIDELTQKFGYRFYTFTPNGPFHLNGARLLLRGTHRHEEHAGYGAAMPDSLHRRDIEQMKDLGVNFLRLGHYPQDPAIYEACDELGIILWDELPWCRGGKGGDAWEANTERLLREQITQNYNHPSIFFWSLGNEIYWLPDFEGGDDPKEMNRFLTVLNNVAHELDPGRLTAIRKYYDGADLVDVFSPSIWSGWYAGVYKNYQQTLEANRPKYPRFLHMEYGGSSHVGRHTETPITGDGVVNPDEWAEAVSQVDVANVAKSGDWSENYIVDLFDWHLSVSETADWFAGNAQWAFKDFGTPLRPENAIPYLNQKGLVDRAGKPKDAYYVYKSYWGKEPFTYIESHTWKERSGPDGKKRELNVFSNCDEVELVHNENSLGRKTRELGKYPAQGLSWELLFEEGRNDFVSRGYKDGKMVTEDKLTVAYTYTNHGVAKDIVLTHRPLDNGNILIVATMRDKDGLRVLDYEDYVYFDLNGAGELLINYGTPTRSQIIQMANGRAAIEMVPGEGKTVIEARNQDFKGSYLEIE
ncbi:glycoside hydrolase family 2 protein [Neolewinella persica]|uniref:glycoside hydrolase family 2 protein n=1 Tax=Neolewinella persica TaxID=70998 RepID=UPI00035C1696|nr:glycoside hydrolase family 2 TIM barrel-domain containing protein [Neolewinella persica]